jgi:O-antigen/teichoic acid export membrane protein
LTQTSSTEPGPTAPIAARGTSTKRLVRGSSLLFAGQLLSKGSNFALQVMIVRCLSQSDYGAFAYALSIVTFVHYVVNLGMGRAVSRFVPIYHEERDWSRLFGSIAMIALTIVSLGLAIALALHGLKGFVGGRLVSDELAMSLLLVMIFLAPVQALDEMMVGLFASLASPKAIFFRKHVLTPALKFAVVAVLVIQGRDVHFLASGYVAAGVLGVLVYCVLLWRTMENAGILQHFSFRGMKMPWRDILTFSIPLLTTDLVFVVMNTMDAVLLEHFKDTTAVASLRAVQPAAKMNELVMKSFATLFLPMAARLFARQDREGLNKLYWQTAIWIACFSFPVFALTAPLAEPMTVLLYGERYADSAIILAMLSFGYYFNAATGFNGMTLKVYRMVKYVVTLNVVTAVINLLLNLFLIPRWGAVGAATGTLCALVIHNILKQTGLLLGTGISIFDWRYARTYVVIVAASASLLAFALLTSLPPWTSVVLAAVASVLVIRLNRSMLTLIHTFPEIMKLPGMRWLFRGSE